MKITEKRLKQIIKEEYQQLNEYVEYERFDDLEARIFDQIIEFKKAFEKSEHKKNRKINMLIKQMLKIEGQLGDVVTELE